MLMMVGVSSLVSNTANYLREQILQLIACLLVLISTFCIIILSYPFSDTTFLAGYTDYFVRGGCILSFSLSMVNLFCHCVLNTTDNLFWHILSSMGFQVSKSLTTIFMTHYDVACQQLLM